MVFIYEFYLQPGPRRQLNRGNTGGPTKLSGFRYMLVWPMVRDFAQPDLDSTERKAETEESEDQPTRMGI